MTAIAIIPARGGSTRIPRKNIKDFNGKPLIAYSIENALNSKVFSHVFVSTDDPEIAEVSQKYGATIPFLRDKSLADNYTTAYDALKDATKRLAKDYEFDTVACIYATAPLITSEDLQKAYKQYQEDKATYLYALCEFPFPIQRAVFIRGKEVVPFMPECFLKRSQDLEVGYQDTGTFYFYKKELLLETSDDWNISVVKLPRYRVVDIDTPEDFEIAKIYAKVIKELECTK